MSRSYNLNADHARQSEGSNRITDTGPYKGHFTRAEAVTSIKGTEGVEFAFETDSEQQADFLTLWTFNKEGKELFGLKMLNAIMTCMKVKNIAPTQGSVEKWNRETGAREKTQATVYPQLMGKPIGLLLQKEDYLKKDNSVGSKLNIWGCFEAATGMVASEILDQAAKPERLAKMSAALKDRPLDASAKVPAGTAPADTGSLADLDSDIPF